MGATNAQGLSRNIPEDVKRVVRRECGHGCVVCGLGIYEYEHIAPPFKDAAVHDPRCIALLCSNCHARVTRRLLSKQRVLDARADPWCIQHGFARSPLDLPPGDLGLHFGSNYLTAPTGLLAVHGRPLIWLEDPEELGLPRRLNAHFQDSHGKEIARIVRNEILTPAKPFDIQSAGPRLTIRVERGPVLLEIERTGGAEVRINKASLHFAGVDIEVDASGRLRVSDRGSQQTYEACTFRGYWGAINIADRFRDPSRALQLATSATIHGTAITHFDGTVLGHRVDNLIVNQHGGIIAYIAPTDGVYAVKTEDYIGQIANEEIVAAVEFDPKSGFPVIVTPAAKTAHLVGGRRHANTGCRLFFDMFGVILRPAGLPII